MSHKLLLADDSITIQRVIELTFAEEDVQVLAVSDGEQAIARIHAERPDIVLADIGMPRRDGYEVAAHVKSRDELSSIPVLLLTGAFEPVDPQRFSDSGADGVLAKPFEPQQVIARVRELLTSRASGAEAEQTPGGNGHDHRDGDGEASAAAQAEVTSGAGGASELSLDAYFDRLDAAFSRMATRPSAPPSAETAPWPVAEEPAPAEAPRVAGVLREEAAADQGHQPSGDTQASTVAAAAGRQAPIADAFAALLAVEQGEASIPASVSPVRPVLDDDTIEVIAGRVAERLGTEAVRQVVREVVLEIAERLVREELDHLKAEVERRKAATRG